MMEVCCIDPCSGIVSFDKEPILLTPQLKGQLLEVSCVFGIPIRQSNGQRISGPPFGYFGPEPERGSEVFVGNLPKTVYEPELLPLFIQAGPIYNMRLMMAFSGTTRGYCFIKYFQQGDACKAVAILNGFRFTSGINKTVLGVELSVDNRHLRVITQSSDSSLTLTEISYAICSSTIGVVQVVENFKNTGRNHIFTVKYNSHRNAANARRILIGGLNVKGEVIFGDWGNPTLEPVTFKT